MIFQLAERFRTRLVSTAIRFCDVGNHRMFLICSLDGQKFLEMNESGNGFRCCRHQNQTDLAPNVQRSMCSLCATVFRVVPHLPQHADLSYSYCTDHSGDSTINSCAEPGKPMKWKQTKVLRNLEEELQFLFLIFWVYGMVLQNSVIATVGPPCMDYQPAFFQSHRGNSKKRH